MIAHSWLWRSAFTELQVVGSRWTRVLAKSTAQNVGPPHVQANLATPYITLIPTLHVASITFYDRVLEYMQQAVRRNPATVILLEGICDSPDAEKQQLAEYLQISQNDELKDTMVEKANANNLYPPEVMAEMCAELALDYGTLCRYEPTVRLQECYLKPKMAALCGRNVRNNADLDMREVQRLLEEEAARLAALGERLPESVSVSDIGKFPIVRRSRERKVAGMARRLCEEWLEQEIEGEVIVPWGFYHTEAIVHDIFEANASTGSSGGGGRAAPGETSTDATSATVASAAGEGRPSPAPGAETHARPSVIFVAADELVAKVSFDLPKELLEPGTGRFAPASDTKQKG